MKFRVHFEASAAIGIEVEIDAKDETEAQSKAERMYETGFLKLEDVVENLLKPSPEGMQEYASRQGMPFTYITVEEDENGFEVVDVFVPTEEQTGVGWHVEGVASSDGDNGANA